MSLRYLRLLGILLCCVGLALADEAADRHKLDALVQEGDLLLQEWNTLRPERDRLAADTARLDAGEQALRTESAGLTEAISAFNAANAELERGAKAHAAECPLESEDKAVVDACNARAAALHERARELEARRGALQANQQALQGRLERHNAARREWAEHKHKTDSRLQLSRDDTDYWLSSARPFLASSAFQALAKRARELQACAAQRLRDIAKLPADEALERAQACLRDVQGEVR